MGKKKETIRGYTLPYRQGPPPMTDAERERLDKLQRDKRQERTLLQEWETNRGTPIQIPEAKPVTR